MSPWDVWIDHGQSLWTWVIFHNIDENGFPCLVKHWTIKNIASRLHNNDISEKPIALLWDYSHIFQEMSFVRNLFHNCQIFLSHTPSVHAFKMFGLLKRKLCTKSIFGFKMSLGEIYSTSKPEISIMCMIKSKQHRFHICLYSQRC